MSVIVAQSSACCATQSTAQQIQDCYPAVTSQKVVPKATSQTVDSYPVSGFSAAKWLITVTNLASTRIRSLEVYSTHQSGTTPTNNCYGIIGNQIRIEVKTTIVGGMVNLVASNYDNEDVVVYATRLAVPISSLLPISNSTVTITSGSTVVRSGQFTQVDTILSTNADILACKWLISITADLTGAKRTTQVYAQVTDNIVAVEYNITGDQNITYDVTINQVAGIGTELIFTNTSSADYVVDVVRVPVIIVTGSNQCAIPNGVKPFASAGKLIPVGSLGTVDTISTNNTIGVKWLVTIRSVISNQIMAYELITTGSEHTYYGILGKYLNVEMSTTILANRIVFEVLNNHTESVYVNFLRIPLTC